MGSDRSAHRTLPLPRAGEPPVPVPPTPTRFTLPNGLHVVAVTRNELPQVAIRLVVPAGSAADPAGAPGTASLVGALLTEGTRNRSATAFNQYLDSLGASLDARVGHDFAEVDLRLLSETLDEGLSLLSEVVESATFPDREVERTRSEFLDALLARLDEPANVADDRTAEALFGHDHPYGRLALGTREGIERVTRADMVAFHAHRYRPEGSVLVIAGDVAIPELRTLLERSFAGWQGRVDPIDFPEWPETRETAGTLTVVEWDDAAQGEIRIAGLGLHRRSAEWIPAAVANFILGGSTITSRLGSNIREDKGWTYGIRSGLASGIQPAGWVIETAVDGEAVGDALGEIDHELRRMTTEHVGDEELDRAREALILSLPRAFETPGRIVARMATIEAFGLEPDYWERYPERLRGITSDEILRISRELFLPERLVRVVVGPGPNEAD
jgi:zinc protease